MKKILIYAISITTASLLALSATTLKAEQMQTTQTKTHMSNTKKMSQKHSTAKKTPRLSLTDNEIAQILITANDSEIEQSRIVRRKADNETVKDFAKHMVDDHKHNTKLLRSAMRDNNIKSQISATSNELERKSEQMSDRLKNSDPREAERLYSQNVRMMHKDLLKMIDNELLPNAKNQELRSHLEHTRREVANHLAQAQQMNVPNERTAVTEPDLD